MVRLSRELQPDRRRLIVFDPTAMRSFAEIKPFKDRLSNERLLLPLDEFVTALSDSTNLPILQDFRGSRTLFARMATISALMAILRIQAWDELFYLRTEQVKRLYKLLDPLDPTLREAQDLLARLADLDDGDMNPYRNLEDAVNRLFLAKEAAAPLSRRMHADHRRNKGHRWRQAFVGALCEPWEKLTGRKPTSNEYERSFLGLVEAAWHSLSPDQPDVPFARAIRTVIGPTKSK